MASYPDSSTVARKAHNRNFATLEAAPAEFPRSATVHYDDHEEEIHDDDLSPPDPPLSHKLVMATAVVVPFLGVVAALILAWNSIAMGWMYVSMVVVGWFLTATGITIGFHRLCSHRSFDTYRWVRAFWMALGALSVQGSPLVWCAVHRKHHRHSDKHGDPHSPLLHGDGWKNVVQGFLHAHTGWLFTGHWTKPELQKFVPDLMADKLLVSIDRVYYLWVILSLAIPAAIGGLVTMSWTGALWGVLWGGLVRIFVTHHATWSINSICHLFGKREFHSGDSARNNVFCGIIACGEGWHNNHHAFPTSARHGLKWWQFDSSWIIIRTMQALGLAWNVRLPSARAMEKMRIR